MGFNVFVFTYNNYNYYITIIHICRLENTSITDEGKELLSKHSSSVDITYEDNMNLKDLLKERRKHKSLATHSSF